MPHYWGANSPWLDTRELVPHRRPTCIVEDPDANLWIGAESNGLVRLNSHGRRYHARPPENNKSSGTEFTSIGSKEVGAKFDKVVSLTAGLERGVWAVLALNSKASLLARFDGNAWSTMHVPGDFDRANCIAEVRPGIALVGMSRPYGEQGLIELDWAAKKTQTIAGPRSGILKVEQMPDGRIFAASSLVLYETSLDPR